MKLRKDKFDRTRQFKRKQLFQQLTPSERDEYHALAMSSIFGCITVVTEERIRVLELLASARQRERT